MRRLWSSESRAGLVWGKELYVDATKVQVNASLESLKPRFAVEAHLANLFAKQAEEDVEEAEQVATQEEPASSTAPQEEMTVPMQLPVSISQELREELSQQNRASASRRSKPSM